jgi:hypothetical protein
MNKRERLLSTLLDKDFSQEKAKILDTTVRFIISDMGKMYINFWNTEGPGVMVFQPTSQERSMFYWTLQEIHLAKETCEQDDNGDLAESLRRILESAQKIDPEASAGYIINDNDGIRYFQIDYNQLTDQ